MIILGTDSATGGLLQLNLPRKSNATPTVSAQAHFSGHQDYNAQPFLPIGSSAEVYVRAGDRKLWDFLMGLPLRASLVPVHLGGALSNTCLKKTKSIRLSDTAMVQKEHITNPEVTVKENRRQYARFKSTCRDSRITSKAQ